MGKIKALVSIMVTILVLVVIGVAIAKKQSMVCEKIELKIAPSSETPLVTALEIERLLADAGLEVVGKSVKDLQGIGGQVADAITCHPFILQCKNVYFSYSALVVEIEQSRPLAHLFSQRKGQYFIDQAGYVIPYHDRFNGNILVANGHIDYDFQKKIPADSLPLLRAIYTVARQVSADPFLNAQFRQIHINENLEMELIPTVGKAVALLGDAGDAEGKLSRLSKVCREALPYRGMNKYTLLDARFKNRIIAKK